MDQQATRQKFSRTKYLVSAKFQLKYVGLILLLMFLTAAVCSYVVYYTSIILLGEKLANVYPQARLVAILNKVNTRVIASMLLLSPVIVLVGIYLSHKIAGPIYRLERYMTDLADGNISGKITLRQGDELVGLADKLNIVTDTLRKTFSNQKSALEKVIVELEAIKSITASRPQNIAVIDANIDRLEKQISELNLALGKYKISQ